MWEDSGLVFTNELGHHLARCTLVNAFKAVVTSIGRPDARFHDLRHSYAVAAIRSGDDIKTVQGNLGHATAAFTLDVYGHVTDQMKRESAARRVPHPPPAGRLGRGGPGLHPLPPLSVCPSPGGPFPTLIAIITMFFVGTSGGPGRGLLAALLLTGVILLGVFLTFGVSRLLSGTLLRGVPTSLTLELPPSRRPRIGQVVVRSVLDRTLFVLGRAAAVAAPAGLLIWLCANVQVGGDSILNWCTGFLDPFARLLGLDGVILMAFLLGFPANEIVIPIIIMAYLSTGSLLEFDSLDALRQLLVDHGWTWLTAVCTMLFSLMHWPCSTTCLTIGKETKSAKWTLLSIAIPTGIGMAVCFLVASAARLLGLA